MYRWKLLDYLRLHMDFDKDLFRHSLLARAKLGAAGART